MPDRRCRSSRRTYRLQHGQRANQQAPLSLRAWSGGHCVLYSRRFPEFVIRGIFQIHKRSGVAPGLEPAIRSCHSGRKMPRMTDRATPEFRLKKNVFCLVDFFGAGRRPSPARARRRPSSQPAAAPPPPPPPAPVVRDAAPDVVDAAADAADARGPAARSGSARLPPTAAAAAAVRQGRGQPVARGRRQGRARRAGQAARVLRGGEPEGRGAQGARVVQADGRRSRSRHADARFRRRRCRAAATSRPAWCTCCATCAFPRGSGESTLSFQMSFGR